MRNIENLDRDSVFVQGEGNYARLILTELDQMLNYSMWLEHCSFRMFSSKISIEISFEVARLSLCKVCNPGIWRNSSKVLHHLSGKKH